MKVDSFTVRCVVPASPEEIYVDWLDGARHSLITGASATGEAKVGAAFTAWGGYISGVNVALDPDKKRIVQRWRTSEFPTESPDSIVTLTLHAHAEGTEIVLEHSEIPEGQGSRYQSGWETHYFTPMKAYYQTPR